MDGNQTVFGTSTRTLIERSLTAKRLGHGLQGVVYEFDPEAVKHHAILNEFLVKRYRPLLDVPFSNAESFRHKLPESMSLLQLPDEFEGRNFGQPVFKDEHGRFAILLRQEGKDMSKWVREDLCKGESCSTVRRYETYLNWLSNVPDDALIDLADKIAFVKSRGYELDHTKKDNLFWHGDATNGHFNLIDLFPKVVDKDAEMADPLRKTEVGQRGVQILYANIFGVRKGFLRDDSVPLDKEVSTLLKESNTRIILSLDWMKEGEARPFLKTEAIKAAEAVIDARIKGLGLNEMFKGKYEPCSRTHTPAATMPRHTLDTTAADLQAF